MVWRSLLVPSKAVSFTGVQFGKSVHHLSKLLWLRRFFLPSLVFMLPLRAVVFPCSFDRWCEYGEERELGWGLDLWGWGCRQFFSLSAWIAIYFLFLLFLCICVCVWFVACVDDFGGHMSPSFALYFVLYFSTTCCCCFFFSFSLQE